MTVRENTAAPHLGQQPPSPMIINCICTRELFVYSIFVCGNARAPRLPLFFSCDLKILVKIVSAQTPFTVFWHIYVFKSSAVRVWNT